MKALAVFKPGEVIMRDGVRGIVTAMGERTVTVVWEHGGRSAGIDLRGELGQLPGRPEVEVTQGMLGYRGWNREQAVRAALRRLDRQMDKGEPDARA